MRLAPWLVTWMWVPLTWTGYWMSPPGGEKTVNYLVAVVMTWFAGTWTMGRLGVLRKVYGPLMGLLPQVADVRVAPPPPPCLTCGRPLVPGVDHSRCR